jgi:hypothetical protein
MFAGESGTMIVSTDGGVTFAVGATGLTMDAGNLKRRQNTFMRLL